MPLGARGAPFSRRGRAKPLVASAPEEGEQTAIAQDLELLAEFGQDMLVVRVARSEPRFKTGEFGKGEGPGGHLVDAGEHI